MALMMLVIGGRASAEPAPLSATERDMATKINRVLSRAAEIAAPAVVQIRVFRSGPNDNPREDSDQLNRSDKQLNENDEQLGENDEQFYERGIQSDGDNELFNNRGEPFDGSDGQVDGPSEILGSGCIISAKGYIVTCNHVVAGAKRIEVVLADGRRFGATGRYLDEDTELAVVRIRPKGAKLPVIRWGDSDEARVGEMVLAIGAPFAFNQTVTSGIISFKGRQTDILGTWGYEDFIQTDAAINKGNSGGPLVNLYGEVIGINSNIYTAGREFFTGYGFAVPSKLAKFVTGELIRHGRVRRGWLGVKMSRVSLKDLRRVDMEHDNRSNIWDDEDLRSCVSWAKQLPERLEGVLILQVGPGSPAERGGMQGRDIVLEVNGKKIRRAAQLKYLIGTLQPGSTAKLLVWRDGRRVRLKVVLGDRQAAKAMSTRP